MTVTREGVKRENSLVPGVLTLGKLEAFPGAGLACLFTLASAGIPTKMTGLFQGRSQFLVIFEKGSGNTQGTGSRLTVHTPAPNFGHDVEFVLQVHRLKGLFNRSNSLIQTEIGIQFLVVYRDVSRPFPEADPCRGSLATAGTEKYFLGAHVREVGAGWALGPCEGVPVRNRFSICATSGDPSCFWATCP